MVSPSIPSMLNTTDAIVLSLQPHSDKAHVLHAYTRTGGRVNYMVYGLGRKHAIGMYTPFTLLQITADHSPSKPPTLKEAVPLNTNPLTSNPYKSAIALFLSEVLYHVLRHPMTDEPMFDFIAQAIQELDRCEEPQNFHLQFLVGLAAKLGFAIEENNPLSSLQTESVQWTVESSRVGGRLPSTRKARQEALRQLCAYFEEHVETWESPRSLEILMEVFD